MVGCKDKQVNKEVTGNKGSAVIRDDWRAPTLDWRFLGRGNV
jgi:hypothetical protein